MGEWMDEWLINVNLYDFKIIFCDVPAYFI